MAASNLNDLFHDTLRDVLWAERHLTKALRKMAKNASQPELAEAFEKHRAQTEGHVERLERVFQLIDKSPRAKTCEAMVGLSVEGDHVIEETEVGPTRDVGLIGAAQAVEHYEIARYGTLLSWARLLGLDEAASLLAETLAEEKATDDLLTALSGNINPEAQSAQNDQGPRRKRA